MRGIRRELVATTGAPGKATRRHSWHGHPVRGSVPHHRRFPV